MSFFRKLTGEKAAREKSICLFCEIFGRTGMFLRKKATGE